MRVKTRFAALIGALLVVSVVVGGSSGAAPVKAPRVTGDWVGTWGISAPPRPGEEKAATASRYSAAEMRLDCKVTEKPGGAWQATFEGECGRPYKYTVTMQGRQAGSVVMFQGTADLGEKDGGVYDWIGRATEDEFVGFFTSQKYTGHFRLARKP